MKSQKVKTGKTDPSTSKEGAMASTPKSVLLKPAVNLKPVATRVKPPKRDNTFSKSRDVREDRGARQMKTMHNSQSFSRGR